LFTRKADDDEEVEEYMDIDMLDLADDEEHLHSNEVCLLNLIE
jgi:hypothetical protein